MSAAPDAEYEAIEASVAELLPFDEAPEAAVEALTEVLHKGLWWAPMRAREWRTEAAAALAQICTPESRTALEEAAASGSFGVRRIAKRFTGR